MSEAPEVEEEVLDGTTGEADESTGYDASGEDGDDDETQGLDDEEGSGFSFDMDATDEDSGFEPMPKGIYGAVVEELEYKMSQSSGKPMWAITWAVTSPAEFAEKNRKLFSYVSFKDTQLGRAKQFVKRIAPELATVKNFSPKRVAEEGLLLGKPARLKVGLSKPTEEYPDPRNEVKDVLAPGKAGSGEGGGSGFAL
jgi:hypothetical protein